MINKIIDEGKKYIKYVSFKSNDLEHHKDKQLTLGYQLNLSKKDILLEESISGVVISDTSFKAYPCWTSNCILDSNVEYTDFGTSSNPYPHNTLKKGTRIEIIGFNNFNKEKKLWLKVKVSYPEGPSVGYIFSNYAKPYGKENVKSFSDLLI